METTTKVRFTAEEFHRMGEVGLLDSDRSCELVDGEIYWTAPQSYDPASRARRVAALLRKRIEHRGLDGADFVQEGYPVLLSEHNEPEPDVALLRGEPGRTPRPEDIRLLIEVSRTTYEKDRGQKWRAYAQAGIPEYWIMRIDPGAPRTLETFRRPEEGAYQEAATYGYDDEIRVQEWPALGTFSVNDLLG